MNSGLSSCPILVLQLSAGSKWKEGGWERKRNIQLELLHVNRGANQEKSYFEGTRSQPKACSRSGFAQLHHTDNAGRAGVYYMASNAEGLRL